MEVDGLKKRRRTPAIYWVCDGLSGALLFFLVIFTPWAFGSTQFWAIWVANTAGYVLGFLWIAKRLLRWWIACRPDRWDRHPASWDNRASETSALRPIAKSHSWLTASLGLLTFLVVGYCLVSAVNARATYYPGRHFLEYHPAIRWLPHSYDSGPTWEKFWQVLGLAFVFWAMRDWLLGISRAESRLQAATTVNKPDSPPFNPEKQGNPEDRKLPRSQGEDYFRLPKRLHQLLLVLCLNGALLAGEGIIQRLSGTDKLLWMKRPRFEGVEGQFGSFAYRTNAVQYLNLIWPLAAGYAWTLARQAGRARRRGFIPASRAYYWLPPAAILMASCSVVSGSRGGVFVGVLQLVFFAVALLGTARRFHWRFRLGLVAFLLLAVQFSFFLGWDQLLPRLKGTLWDQYQTRQQVVVENALRMANDYPLFGTGPGTFTWLYQFFMGPGDAWLAHVHNDWVETRVTFGWVGLALIVLCLVPVALHWFVRHGIPVSGMLAASTAIALGGCLLHGFFDFPFQIHSVLNLFLLLSCVLFTGRRL